MSLSRYETLILVRPEITKDEASEIEAQFQKTVKNATGGMISYERWGKYRLAYPVKKHDYGVYFLSRFEIDRAKSNSLVKEIKSFFEVKFPVVVMRNMTTALQPDQSLAYYKPESLEDTPMRDVDSFIRENKMEGVLKAIPSQKTKEASPKEEVKAQEDTNSQNGSETGVEA